MGKVKKLLSIAVILIAVLVISGVYLSSVNVPVLEPKGLIADKEFRLLLLVVGLMLIVVIPVFVMLAFIIWRYRDGSVKRGKYMPDWDHSRIIEGVWWLVPSILVLILSIITWNATYALNPYKPIPSKKSALIVEAIALDWKWLFIYPKQHVASVNQVVFPEKTPIHFYLTSDAPMNSFWVPQLSGQIYAMPGMQTQLFLMSSGRGIYNGWSANISGIGFAGMMFKAVSTTNARFNKWVKQIGATAKPLTSKAYSRLSKPSSYVPITYYSRPAHDLFYNTMTRYLFAPKKGQVT